MALPIDVSEVLYLLNHDERVKEAIESIVDARLERLLNEPREATRDLLEDEEEHL